jgi:hypothetical protein
VAAVLTLVQTNQVRINIHKQNNTKNTVQTIQHTLNTSKHLLLIPTEWSKKLCFGQKLKSRLGVWKWCFRWRTFWVSEYNIFHHLTFKSWHTLDPSITHKTPRWCPSPSKSILPLRVWGWRMWPSNWIGWRCPPTPPDYLTSTELTWPEPTFQFDLLQLRGEGWPWFAW